MPYDREKYLEYLELKKQVKKSLFKLIKSPILKDKSEENLIRYLKIHYHGYKNIEGCVRVLLSDLTWSKRLKCVNGQYSEIDE
jgi:hypothetical protein